MDEKALLKFVEEMDCNWSHTKQVLFELKSSLKCLICEELPRNPHMMWCKHSFCKECISKKQKCPKCNYLVEPQKLTPDIKLIQLLALVEVTSKVSKCHNQIFSEERKLPMMGQRQKRKESTSSDNGVNKEHNVDNDINAVKRSIESSNSKSKMKLDLNNTIKNCIGLSENDSPLSTKCVTPSPKVKRRTSLKNTNHNKSVENINDVNVMITPKTLSSKTSVLYSAKKHQVGNKRNKKGETPLHIACRQGKLEKVQELLGEGAEPNVKDYAHWTPLCDAVGLGNIKIVNVLLEAGAAVNTPCNQNTTPLIEAVLQNNKDMVLLLMKYGADKDQRSSLDNTAWTLADKKMKGMLEKASNVPIMPHPRIRVFARSVMVQNLSPENICKVKSLCEMFNLSLTVTFTDETTHIIVEKSANNTCQGSTPVMLGILNGCSVVAMDWVIASLEAQDLLPVDNFEPSGTDDHSDCNVFTRARINREQLLPKLFDGCHISLQHTQFWATQTKKDLVALVEASGAMYHPRVCDPEGIPPNELTVMFHTSPMSSLGKLSHIILYQSDIPGNFITYNMSHAKSFTVDWFVQCVRTFTIS